MNKEYEILKKMLPLLLLVIFISCSTTPAATGLVYRIGDIGPAGGIIFFDKGNNSDGWRYLEAAPSETERVPMDFVSDHLYSQINDRSLGAGLTNTRIYLEKLRINGVTGSTAPWICDTLVCNGYDDWFLPSLDETLMMYTNLGNNMDAGFLPMKYWTSSCYPEVSDHPGAAYFVNFSNGQASFSYMGETHFVHAVRRF